MEQLDKRLPNWATRLLRLIVHPDFLEEIEGDLLEKYQTDQHKYGENTARRLLYAELLSLLKLNLVFNLNQNAMKAQNWYVFLLVALGVTLASVAPFLPGPQNGFSHGLSQFAQAIGYIGLFFIPFGLVWLVIEIRNRNGQKLNRWANGYYPALLTISPLFILMAIQLFKGLTEGARAEIAPLIFISLGVAYVVYRIQKLKNKIEYRFNKAPVYIVLIPIVALVTSRFAVETIAGITREAAIQKTEPLITAIEKFKSEKGEYPEQLDDLRGKYITAIPISNIMGNSDYFYEKRGEVYQLSFERKWHWYATEAVVYMKYGNKITKSNYNNYPTKHPDWRYFMVD